MPKGTFSDFEGLRYLRLNQKGEKFSSPHPMCSMPDIFSVLQLVSFLVM